MTLRVRKRTPTAILPSRGSQEAAGYDLSACLGDPTNASTPATLTLQPGARTIVPTGLSITVPEGTYGRIGPRSGLAVKHGIDVLAGIVDRDYTGEVGVVLINLGTEPFVVAHGDRVAQLVLERITTPPVEEVAELETSLRGEGGYGSTGV